jgi:hypothetical protein
MKKVYDFYADPGHGWLKVKLSELVKLNILHEISQYSYIRKDDVYLEEDCDLSVFMKAKGIDIKFREHHSNKSSKIRNYNRLMFV